MSEPIAITRKIAFIAGVVLLALLFVAYAAWNYERKKRMEAERQAEENELRGKGLLVETRATRDDLDSRLHATLASFQQLKGQLDEAKAKAPQTKVVEVTHVVTKTVIVPGPSGQCVLATGDPARIEVGEVHLQTKLGNEIVAGVASAWRADKKLFESPFEATASRTARERTAVQDPLGWGIGPHFQMNKTGIGGGFVIGTPIVNVFGFKVEATGAAAIGSKEISGALNALIRR